MSGTCAHYVAKGPERPKWPKGPRCCLPPVTRWWVGPHPVEGGGSLVQGARDGWCQPFDDLKQKNYATRGFATCTSSVHSMQERFAPRHMDQRSHFFPRKHCVVLFTTFLHLISNRLLYTFKCENSLFFFFGTAARDTLHTRHKHVKKEGSTFLNMCQFWPNFLSHYCGKQANQCSSSL